MKLESISAIEKILGQVYSGRRSIVCLGVNHAQSYLLEPFCYGKAPRLPLPKRIYDYVPNLYSDELDGIPVLAIENIKAWKAEEAVIIIAAEDKEFYGYLGDLYDNLHCYYFPILPCTAIDAYFYALEHETEIYNICELFSETKSQKLYLNYWESRIAGCVYDPMLFSDQPYWGNELIPFIPNSGVVILGGAYNGQHIDRAKQMNSKLNAILFEPNPEWAKYLCKKYNGISGVDVVNKALYNDTCSISFDTSNELGAQIRVDGNGDCVVQTVRLDDFDLRDVAIIALDIEGTELEALEGAINTIRLCKPILAICSYHKISDYIDIPLFINQLNLKYKLFFRQHSCYYEESVIYAIPEK